MCSRTLKGAFSLVLLNACGYVEAFVLDRGNLLWTTLCIKMQFFKFYYYTELRCCVPSSMYSLPPAKQREEFCTLLDRLLEREGEAGRDRDILTLINNTFPDEILSPPRMSFKSNKIIL